MLSLDKAPLGGSGPRLYDPGEGARVEIARIMIAPHQCRTMAEVRNGVDALDQEIVALLGERFRFMDAAARIKSDRASVRDEDRKAQVIANVRMAAAATAIPLPVIEDLYERLVEASIAYELKRFDSL